MYLLSLTFLYSLTLFKSHDFVKLLFRQIITFLGTFVGFESKLSPNDIHCFVVYKPVALMMGLISSELT